MYELITSGTGIAPVGFGNMTYEAAVDKGAKILFKNPYLTVLLRPIIDIAKVKTDIKEMILKNSPEDYDGFVWNNLLWDDGVSGASYYEIKLARFKRLVLDCLDEIIDGKL